MIADSGAEDRLRPVPETMLETAATAAAGFGTGAWRGALPEAGGRIALAAGDRRLGWLDVWGDGRPVGAEARRALGDFAQLIALLPGSEAATASGG